MKNEKHNENIKRAEVLMDLEEFGHGITSKQKTELEGLIIEIEKEEDKIIMPWDKKPVNEFFKALKRAATIIAIAAAASILLASLIVWALEGAHF